MWGTAHTERVNIITKPEPTGGWCMQFETVVWYNPGNRFALIKPDGRQPYLVQLTPEQAITAPFAAGQRFEIHPPDAETLQGRNHRSLLAATGSTPMRANEEIGQ
jgi:hypothetical protein